MAKIYGQLEKAQLENLTSDPSALVAGLMWYRTDQKLFKVYDGTVVQTFVDLTTAQTLSNKILASPELTGAITFNQTTTPTTPAAGKNKFYYKTDGLLYTLDSAGNEALVGSGAEGGGAMNLISNGSAESTAVSIFTPYADAAGTRPVDGIGGSPTVTTAINTSNVLVKNKDFTLIKPASNCQGQGWAISNIALPLAYRGKSIKSFLEYLVNSGTFVPGTTGNSPTDGDAIVYFYDQTNSKLMEPSNIKFLGSSTTISDKYESTVQFDINCTQVRMIIHVASTSALAWTLQVDNITLSPQNYAYGTPVTDFGLPITYTSNITTNATLTTRTRRIGDSYHVTGNIIYSGANTQNVTPTIILPYTIDSTKVSSTGTLAVGQYSIQNSGSGAVSNGSLVARLPSFGASAVVFEGVANNANSPFTVAAGHSWGFEFTVPVVGLSSSVQISDGFDARDIVAVATIASGVAITLNQPINFASVGIDTVAGITTGAAWKYTAKSAGYYDISLVTTVNAGNNYQIYKNGASQGYIAGQTSSVVCGGSRIIQLNVGDYIDIRPDASATTQIVSYVQVKKLSGAQAIAATEKMYLFYRNSSGQSIPNATQTTVTNWTKSSDSHNAFNPVTGIFTAPNAGTYEIFSMVTFGDSTSAGDRNLYLRDVTNSVDLVHSIRPYSGAASGQTSQSASAILDLLSGQQIAIQVSQGAGVAQSIVGVAVRNTLSIKQVK